MKQFMVTTFLDLFLRVILAALFLKGMGQHRNLARMAGRVDDRNDIIRDFVPEYR